VVLRAGLQPAVAGMTVDRQCASGLMAIAIAAKQSVTDDMAVTIGGVESILLVQNAHRNTYQAQDHWLAEHGHSIYISTLETAENVAARYGVSRDAQDAFALTSQQRTAAAVARTCQAASGDREPTRAQGRPARRSAIATLRSRGDAKLGIWLRACALLP